MDITVCRRGCSTQYRSHGTMEPMKGRVLVVDDDAALAEMLGIVLRGEGFEPTFVADGDKALEVFRDSHPDLVLLDLMLPSVDGIDVCRQIRAESGVPIVMLTAKTDTVDVVLGLESGADDYIVKPFKSKELIARVRARLRRTDEPAPEMLQIQNVMIDVAGHSVKRDDVPVSLTPLEFDLLVNVHVQRLRAKIEKDPEHPEIVVTVRGVGYRAGPGSPRGGPGNATDGSEHGGSRGKQGGPGRCPMAAVAGRARLARGRVRRAAGPVAPVAAAARRGYHAGHLGARGGAARLLPHAADRRRPAGEQGDVGQRGDHARHGAGARPLRREQGAGHV